MYISTMNANELFTKALAKVESASIRSWATSERNGPLWLAAAEDAVNAGKNDPNRFATLIVATAIGL